MPLTPLLAMPLDKGPGSFERNVNDLRNDLFDQFFNLNPLNADASMLLSAPESTLLVSSVGGSDSARTSIPMWTKDEAAQDLGTRSAGEPLQGEIAASYYNDVPIGNALELGKLGRAAGLNLDLLSLEKISLQSPSLKTPPSSPEFLVNKTRARNRIPEELQKQFHLIKENKLFRKATSPIRKVTSPGKMRRSQHNEANHLNWDPQLVMSTPGFDFDFQDQSLSPPISSRQPGSSNYNNQMLMTPQPWDEQISEQIEYGSTEDADSPLITPSVDMNPFDQLNMHHTTSNNILYPSHQGYSSTHYNRTSHNSDYNFEARSSEDQELGFEWENTTAAPPTETYRWPSQTQTELSSNANRLTLNPSSGLMIQMPYTTSGQSFSTGHPSMGSEQGYYGSAAGSASPDPQPHYGSRYTHPQLLDEYTSRPTRQERPHSQSRTESFSTSPPPRSHGSSSSKHHSKKKHSSSRKHAAAATTTDQKSPPLPKTSKGSSAPAGFVNLTPQDKNKLLTGVAPSGSSKTKARREREAAEKTRRLSQAVLAAGGSIDKLVEQGLIPDSDLEETS